MGAPPHSRGKSAQVSDPGSPFAGTVQKRQVSFPVSAEMAATKPRWPDPPPVTPTRTLSFTTTGAAVAE